MLGVPLLYEKLYAGILRGVGQKPLPVRVLFGAMAAAVKGLRVATGLRLGRAAFRGLREKAGIGTIRLFISGGAPLPVTIAQGFEDLGITFVQGYGLTETSPILTVNPVERPRHDSVGIPVPGAEVRILDEDGDGVGEILARGDILMRGYYRRPDLTAEVIRDGWFHTGDLGRFGRDGYLRICGRLKNLIVTRGGKNVHPEEIEGVLNASPVILESLVYGIPSADGGGEEIAVLAVPDPERFEQMGAERGSAYTWEETERLVREEIRLRNTEMADYKRIREIAVRREELPKTSTRKIRRFAVPEVRRARGAPAGGTGP
jgi:long-chain acyl-CoA synthetase